MKSGRLRHRVQFQRLGEGTDRYGQTSTDFSDLGDKIYANVRETTGKERIVAGSVENARTATIRVRKSPFTDGVDEADQVIARGETWRISGIANVDDRDKFLDMLCEAVGK